MSTAELLQPSSTLEAWVARWNASALSPLALTTNKSAFWSANRDCVLPYAQSRGYALALGEPLGPVSESVQTMREFVAFCREQNLQPAMVPVSENMLPLGEQLGLVTVPIGEEGRISLSRFGLEGGLMKTMRQSRTRLLRQRFVFEMWEPPLSSWQLQILREVSDDWLATKQFRESRFGLGWFDPEYVSQSPIGVVRNREGRTLAFASCFQTLDRSEVGIDLLRHDPEAPTGVMDFLIAELALWHRDRNAEILNLGLSPLAGVRPESPWGAQSLIAVQKLFQTLVPYNFDGLRRFKNKFRPAWHPRYLMVPRRRDLIPTALMAWSGEPKLRRLWP